MENLLASPSLLQFLLLLPLILLPVYILRRKSKHDSSLINFPPSPPKLPIIGNLHQLGSLPHRSLWKLSQKYGPVMLLQLGQVPTLVISSAETAKEVLKTQDLEFCSRAPLFGPKRLSYNFLDVAFAPYGEYWREMRKLCVLELFSVKRVQSFGFIIEEEVSSMVDSLSSISPIDISQKFLTLTSQIVCRIAFGKSYQKGEFGNASRFEEIVNEAMAMLGSISASDIYPNKVGWIIDILSGLHRRLEKSFHDFDDFYEGIIDEHLDPERSKMEHEDIIDVLLKLEKDQLSEIHLTKDHIKAILMNVFLAGVDSSAVTMTWAMTELVRRPESMKKVQEEIRSYVGMKKGKVEDADLDHFQYLKMVIKETLRLHPSGPLLIPRETIKHSKIQGYDIYPKTRVFINVWAIGRNPDYWEKPDEFFPERFINSSIDIRGQDFNFLPFGGGRRGCPGINLGMAMVELGLANLLYSFDWELPKGMKKEDINMDESTGITVHKKSPLQLVPIKVL